MNSMNVLRPAFAASMCIAAMILLISCVQPAVKGSSPSEPASSPTPATGFPMDPKAFQDKYHVQLDWIPSQILDYDEESNHSEETDNAAIKWYIVSAGNNTIEVNEVEWVLDSNEPNGFRIDDASAETKSYPLSDDAGVWLMYESAPLYRIPVSDLASYIHSQYGNDTLWNFKLRDDKVTLLTQQYLP
jgi:hypothetical protein